MPDVFKSAHPPLSH